MHIAGKSVVVTGAGHGIGRALAMRFGLEGAKVAVADVEEAAARHTAGCEDAHVAWRGWRAGQLSESRIH